jgi:hypothetical protein
MLINRFNLVLVGIFTDQIELISGFIGQFMLKISIYLRHNFDEPGK